MTRKSPLKASPLRSAGQSISERQVEILERQLLWPLCFWLAFFMLSIYEWVRYFAPRDPSPLLFTLLAVLATVFCLWRVFSVRSQLKRLRLAINGERIVGEFLERLRGQGYTVFHDIVGEGFNLDHVLIGPGGVFTIETKTYSKPARGKPVMTFDGERIKASHWEPDRNPVIQARAQVGWLRSLLKETTGRDFPVHPVIVFPGWFVRSEGRPKRPIWVLNPKALPEFLKRAPKRLEPEDISLASFHLSRFIRAEEDRRQVK